MTNHGTGDPVQNTFRRLESDWHLLLKIDEEHGMSKNQLDAEQNQALERLSKTALLEENNGPEFRLTESGRKMKDTVEEIINLTGYRDRDVNVLAIEDDPDMASMLGRWMENELEYKIIGSEEYRKEISVNIDVVVVERFLKKNVEDIINEIKSEWPEKPIIALLGADPDLEDKDLKADEHIVKPVSKDEFIQKIRDAKNR